LKSKRQQRNLEKIPKMSPTEVESPISSSATALVQHRVQMMNVGEHFEIAKPDLDLFKKRASCSKRVEFAFSNSILIIFFSKKTCDSENPESQSCVVSVTVTETRACEVIQAYSPQPEGSLRLALQ
jgi:hypothetical protein